MLLANPRNVASVNIIVIRLQIALMPNVWSQQNSLDITTSTFPRKMKR